MPRRPRHPKNDANHAIVRRVVSEAFGGRYMGFDLRLIDTAKAGGNLTDWLLIIGPLVVFIEVKQPGEAKRLTPGERETMEWGVPFAVVEDEQDVANVLYKYGRLARALAQEAQG